MTVSLVHTGNQVYKVHFSWDLGTSKRNSTAVPLGRSLNMKGWGHFQLLKTSSTILKINHERDRKPVETSYRTGVNKASGAFMFFSNCWTRGVPLWTVCKWRHDLFKPTLRALRSSEREVKKAWIIFSGSLMWGNTVPPGQWVLMGHQDAFRPKRSYLLFIFPILHHIFTCFLILLRPFLLLNLITKLTSQPRPHSCQMR